MNGWDELLALGVMGPPGPGDCRYCGHRHQGARRCGLRRTLNGGRYTCDCTSTDRVPLLEEETVPDIGIGPHVKCAAVVAIPPRESTRLVFGNQACVLSPADGHTYHRTAGAVYGWEGLSSPGNGAA